MIENALGKFERLAAEFYAETGMMRPGKDVPAEMWQPPREERQRAFDEWLAKRNLKMTETMWMDEVELILEEYAADIIDEDEARARLKGKGFDLDEIDDQLWAAKA